MAGTPVVHVFFLLKLAGDHAAVDASSGLEVSRVNICLNAIKLLFRSYIMIVICL